MKYAGQDPLCRQCRYNLISQLEDRAPNWKSGDGPVELWCPECNQTSTWPWVSPPPAHNKIPLFPFLLSVLIIALVGAVAFFLISVIWL